MISSCLAFLVWLILGLLYPAFKSFKAVKSRDPAQYLQWMMYWIVFALFTVVEIVADIIFAFWFPFYYELKMALMVMMIIPVSTSSLGSSLLYRNFVDPMLANYESQIDNILVVIREKVCQWALRLAGRAFRSVADFAVTSVTTAFYTAEEEGPRFEFSSDSETEAAKLVPKRSSKARKGRKRNASKKTSKA